MDFTFEVESEVNDILASEFKNRIGNKGNILIDIAKVLDKYDVATNSQGINCLENIIDIIKGKPITPITLGDIDFVLHDENGKSMHHRYHRLWKFDTPDETYYRNDNAWEVVVKAIYLHDEKRQMPVFGIHTYQEVPIYITKGGIVTGEYFIHSYIKGIDVNKPFSKFDPIIIPVSKIYNKDEMDTLTVDHREPKLKELHDNYTTPIFYDSSIKGKYNIRKYSKLNKNVD